MEHSFVAIIDGRSLEAFLWWNAFGTQIPLERGSLTLYEYHAAYDSCNIDSLEILAFRIVPEVGGFH